MLISSISFAQVEFKTPKPSGPKKVVKTPTDFGIVESLGDIKAKSKPFFRKHKVVPNKLRRFDYTNYNALPEKEDPVRQIGQRRSTSLTPLKAWNGMDEVSQGASPPDPSGAAGKNHYIQMVNIAMEIYDKSGNSLWGPSSLSSVFPGSADDGDPIVMYDQFADRWFISQFQQTGNKILIAISQTSDPLGSWYYYDYSFDEFPDYPKFSIWGDGYYMTANMGVQNAVCFERDKMLAGDPSARMVALTIPEVSINGFFSALPAHASGDILPTDHINFFYFQDDGWAPGEDRIKIWEMQVDWSNPDASIITVKQELPVAPFNTEFDSNWEDLQQPGTAQRIDAVPNAFMFMGHYRSFGEYNAITLCKTVDVDLTTEMQAAVRWYELRQVDGTWSLYQQGTYSPDSDSRFMGSIALDRKGNIGLAYSITSSTTFPSLKFTGRKKDDPTGTMTISESDAFDGSGSQLGNARFGDYAQMTVDPEDGLTFWYTGEYIGSNGWETGIFSFKIGEEEDFDIGMVEIINPISGVLTAAEPVTILVKNYGKNTLTNIPIHYKLDDTTFDEIIPGPISSGDTIYYTFSQLGDFSTPGDELLTVYASLGSDGDQTNDTINSLVSTAFEIDAGITQILSPLSGLGLTNEDLTVNIKNYGIQTLNEIPLVFKIDGALIRDTLKTPLLSGESTEFTFVLKGDFETTKTYQLISYTDLATDMKTVNDTAKASITNANCNPVSDCTFGDRIIEVTLSDLINTSGCSINGYGNYTGLSASLVQGGNYQLGVKNEETAHRLSVWIDYNDNLVFETDELVLENGVYSLSGEFSIQVLANAPLGEHLMRIRTHWLGASNDPCVEYDYGETEDYSVIIVAPDSVNEIDALDFELINSGNNLIIRAIDIFTKDLDISIFNGLGQQLYSFNNPQGVKLDLTVPVVNFAGGIYYVKIQDGKNKKVKQFVVN